MQSRKCYMVNAASVTYSIKFYLNEWMNKNICWMYLFEIRIFIVVLYSCVSECLIGTMIK